MKNNNTFGEFKFPRWVPVNVSEQIIDFWGCFGRTYKDWLSNSKDNQKLACTHGPGPNGFGNPPYGATVEYVFRDFKLSKENSQDIYKVTRGRYVHAWSNIGRLVDEYGEVYYPSSCDRWIRIFT